MCLNGSVWDREGYIRLPHERYCPPECNQRPLPLALDRDPEDPSGSPWGLDNASEPSVDLGDRDVQLGRQRLGQRFLHHPLESAEQTQVDGQPVVLDKPPELQLEADNDVVDRPVDPFHPRDDPAVSQVGGALGPHDVAWHFQSDLAVDGSAATPVTLAIVVEDGDLIAEETGGTCPPVGDQRLCLRELQLEFIPQELAELALDLLGLASWPGEPEQEVIGLCRGPDYAEEPRRPQ